MSTFGDTGSFLFCLSVCLFDVCLEIWVGFRYFRFGILDRNIVLPNGCSFFPVYNIQPTYRMHKFVCKMGKWRFVLLDCLNRNTLHKKVILRHLNWGPWRNYYRSPWDCFLIQVCLTVSGAYISNKLLRLSVEKGTTLWHDNRLNISAHFSRPQIDIAFSILSVAAFYF